MKLGHIMTLEVETVRPDDSVQRAAELMRDLDIGMIPVVDGPSVVGVVTDRDVAVRFVAEGFDKKPAMPVSEIMSREVFYCYEDQDVSEAAKIMEDKQIRRMIVLSRDNKLVGIVSLGDLARKEPRSAEPVLEHVSEPGSHRRAEGAVRRGGGAHPSVFRDSGKTDADAVNALIRDELAAVETYRQAMDKFGGATAAELRRLENDHERAVALLQEKVAEKGVEPATSSGAWGAFAKTVEGTAKLLGKTAALKALKEGEEHGIKDYEAALEDDSVPADVRALIQTHLLPQTKAHVPVLDRFLHGRTPPGGMTYNADQGQGPAGGGRGVA